MKKTIAILLAAAILALCLSGCGNKKEVEFGAKVHNFIEQATDSASDILSLCVVEYQQLQDDGIGAEKMDSDYYKKCANRFTDEGYGNMTTMLTNSNLVDQMYQEIMAMNVKAENADGLKDAVQRLYEAHQKLLARSTNIYGPAEDFLNECSGYFADVSGAHSDAVDLLAPYNRKPGYVDLIN